MIKKVTLILLILFVFLPHADTITNLKPSIYSVQLKTNGLYTVSSLLPGTMISIKKMMNSIDGYRISVGVNADINNVKDGENVFATDNTDYSIAASLHVSYLRYLYRNRNMYLYFGIGPFGSYSYLTSRQTTQVNTSSNYTIGVDVLPGIEWFILEHISLLLEYDVDCFYQYGENNTIVPGSNLQVMPLKTRRIKLEYNSVFIGLSINL